MNRVTFRIQNHSRILHFFIFGVCVCPRNTQVTCLTTNLNAIKASDAACEKLVTDLISLEELAVASAPYSR